MDLRKLKTLIELVENSGIAELELTEGEEHVRISRSSSVAAPMQQYYAAAPQAAPAPSAEAEPPAAAAKAATPEIERRCLASCSAKKTERCCPPVQPKLIIKFSKPRFW